MIDARPLMLLERQHTSGRLRQETLNYWREYFNRPPPAPPAPAPAADTTINQASKPPLNIVAVCYLEDAPIALSGLVYDVVSNTTRYNFTVVHKDYRRQGHGGKLYRIKLMVARSHGVTNIRTIVAEDNEASIAMCKSSGLLVSGSEVRTRRDGETYTALVFSSG